MAKSISRRNYKNVSKRNSIPFHTKAKVAQRQITKITIWHKNVARWQEQETLTHTITLTQWQMVYHSIALTVSQRKRRQERKLGKRKTKRERPSRFPQRTQRFVAKRKSSKWQRQQATMQSLHGR